MVVRYFTLLRLRTMRRALETTLLEQGWPATTIPLTIFIVVRCNIPVDLSASIRKKLFTSKLLVRNSGAGILLAAICLLIPASSATHQVFQPARGGSKKKKTQYEKKIYAYLSILHFFNISTTKAYSINWKLIIRIEHYIFFNFRCLCIPYRSN